MLGHPYFYGYMIQRARLGLQAGAKRSYERAISLSNHSTSNQKLPAEILSFEH